MTESDVIAAKDVWGKDSAYSKGHATRRKPDALKINAIDIPGALKDGCEVILFTHGFTNHQWTSFLSSIEKVNH